MKVILILLAFSSFFLFSCEKDEEITTHSMQTISVIGVGQPISFDVTYDELSASTITNISMGDIDFFIGYRQVSSNNQNPILLRYDNGQLTWSLTDIETSMDDSRGYGLVWDGEKTLYAVFSSTGTQGTVNEDYRRYAQNGWLSSYGQGGGPKVAVIAKIEPETGAPLAATYVTAQTSDGNSNSVEVTGMDITSDNKLQVTADSWYSPRDIQGNPMNCEGDSPFTWKLAFSENLNEALQSSAEGCCCSE